MSATSRPEKGAFSSSEARIGCLSTSWIRHRGCFPVETIKSSPSHKDIARYERAGLGHLAVSHRRKLAAFRVCEAEAGRKLRPGNPHIARDCDAEERMQRMYGSAQEDRARILQFLRRNAERTLAGRHGLPSRFSRYEVI